MGCEFDMSDLNHGMKTTKDILMLAMEYCHANNEMFSEGVTK